jgi:agarase
VWWLLDANGSATLSIGVDTIRYEGDRIRTTGAAPYLEAVKKLYPDRASWGQGVLARLRSWGFNTIGAWSDPELWDLDMPYTVILDIAERAGADWQRGRPADVFDPQFEDTARKIAQEQCALRAQSRSLIGYFSDNELRWGPDWRGEEAMLTLYLGLPATAPGKARALAFLRQKYSNDIGRLNRAWNIKAKDFAAVPSRAVGLAAASVRPENDSFRTDADEFLELMASRYFEVCARAVHTADPNHLYLGARFAGTAPDPVIRAARTADVVSVNVYSFDPQSVVQHLFELTGRPILITEFAFRARDSGLPNTRGAGPKVPSQAARAKAYADYAARVESLPEAIGYHWFQWSDEPREGRFDGEDSNYGLVDIADKPYTEFVEAVRAANKAAVEAHQRINSGF